MLAQTPWIKGKTVLPSDTSYTRSSQNTHSSCQLSTNLSVPKTPSDSIIHWKNLQDSGNCYAHDSLIIKGIYQVQPNKRTHRATSAKVQNTELLFPLLMESGCITLLAHQCVQLGYDGLNLWPCNWSQPPAPYLPQVLGGWNDIRWFKAPTFSLYDSFFWHNQISPWFISLT